MIEDSDLTLEQLHDRWHEAQAAVAGSAPGSPEREAAVKRATMAEEAHRYRLEVMAQDLRDG